MPVANKLLEKYGSVYKKATQHELTNKLCEGTLPDEILFTYLVQDLKYFKIGLNFFGKTLSLCDDLSAMITLGKQIGFVSTLENDYFDTCIAELGSSPEVMAKVPSMTKADHPNTLPEVKKYIDYVKYLVHDCKSYPELVSALFVMEQVYLGWAQYNLVRNTVPSDLPYKYKEWINLHSGRDFTTWTNFLRSEVDRVGVSDMAGCEAAFKTTLELEVSFFDACYNYNENT